jgi:uncharacterized protein
MLLRPHSGLRIEGGPRTEIAVGFAGGLVGGLTAMPGAVPVLYCDCKGCPKEVQRATVQPFILGVQVLALTLMVATGAVDREVVGLVAMAVPALAAGIAIGLMLFGRVPDAGFRRAVLILLLVTSAGLMVRPSPVRTSEARTVSEPFSAIVPTVTESGGARLAYFSESRC